MFIPIEENQLPVLIQVKSRRYKSFYGCILKNRKLGIFFQKADKKFRERSGELYDGCFENQFCGG